MLIDLVVNHTSDKHAWFQEARSDPKSKYRDWYVWSKKKPKHANDGVVFPGVQKSTWNYDKVARAWYFHRFYDFQPDLNTSNPEVQAEILKIMGFWIQLGVSGFRMDAVPFVIAEKGADVKRPSEQYDMLRTFAEFLSWRKATRSFLAEANVLPETDMEYFGDAGERLQMMFNFAVNQHLFYALASGRQSSVDRKRLKRQKRPKLLRNGDNSCAITMNWISGGLTDETARDSICGFWSRKDMQLYERGIRRRLAPMLQGDRRRLELAYSLMMSLPGTPVLRYGDEIGMGDDLRFRNVIVRERRCSGPLNRKAGFTKSDKPILPVISGGAYGFEHVNVAQQRRDPDSLMNWMERMIRMRKEVPEIGWGDFTIIPTRSSEVLAIRYDWRNNSVVVVHNLSAIPREVCLEMGPSDEGCLVNLLIG